MTSGEGVNAFVQNAFSGYDAMTNRMEVGTRREEDRLQRATKAKQDAQLFTQTLKQNRATAEMSERKNEAQEMLMQTVPQAPNPEVEALKAEIATLKKVTSAQTAKTAIDAVKGQVFAKDSQATLPQFNATVQANPALVELFGDQPARMPDINNVSDRQAVFEALDAQGIKPTPEAAKKAIDTGLFYMGDDGKVVDSRALMALMGAHKTFTPEENAQYEKLNAQLHGKSDEPEAVDSPKEEKKEVVGTMAQPEITSAPAKLETTDGTGTGTQVGYVEPTEEELNAIVDKKIEANRVLAESQMTEPQKAIVQKLDTVMTPEQQNTLRLIAGYGDTPKVKTSATAELYDMAKELTPDRDTFKSDDEYDAAVLKTYKDLKFKTGSLSGGGATSVTRTMTEMADKVNNPSKYSPAEVEMARNWIDAHNPAKTGTIRNKEYEAARMGGTLGGPQTSTGGGALPPLPAMVPSKGQGKGAKAPLAGPGSAEYKQVQEETQFNMYNPTAKEPAFKKEKGEFVQNAQGLAGLKKLQTQIQGLYKGGKMTAGPLDNLLTSFGAKVPYLDNGQVDQVAAEAKIKNIVHKNIKMLSGTNASNRDVERQMEMMFGPSGSQEPIRLRLFNDYVDSVTENYAEARTRMLNNKQYSIVKQADKAVGTSGKPKFVEGRIYQNAKGQKAKYVGGKWEVIR